MKNGFLILLLLFCLPFNNSAQDIFQEPLSPRNANYHIDVTLDTQRKMLSGSEVLVWKNITDLPVQELRFHLYMNAFRNLKSTFLREYSRRHRRFGEIDPQKLGGIDIRYLILNEHREITDRIEFIRPDDGNSHDSTVIRVPLPRPVKPGQQISLEIGFRTRLPKIISRTGYHHDFFLIGQWFPKIGVFMNGEWNCHQFHPNSEFFADFGVYDVRLTLPNDYIVGASGRLTERQEDDSLQTLIFRAEDVHDFAITAWPGFREDLRQINGIQVRLLYDPLHSGQVEDYFKAITAAIQDMGRRFMPYPYPNLTLVDPPIFAFRAAGMEYPGFITCGSIWGFPNSIKLFPEEVTVHEFVHQYFYGIIATNEFEEPWLDEGFTSFFTQKVMNHLYGLHTSLSTFLGINIGSLDYHRKNYLVNPDEDIIVKPAWEFRLGGYSQFTYDKPVLVLQTLENYLGEATMQKIMKSYFQRWKFKHPRTEDFIHIVNEYAPERMDWYFRQALYHTDILDYSIAGISNQQLKSGDQNAPDSAAPYKSRVEVQRKGTFTFPVEIAVVFSDADTVVEYWNGEAPYKVFTFRGEAEVLSAEVDPKHKIPLDINRTNNSRTIRENREAVFSHLLKALQIYQHVLFELGSF